jgi:hypothetical protein
MADPIVFKVEASVWEMMASGRKCWDARRWDMDDERIVRLAKGHWEDYEPVTEFGGRLGRMPYWQFDEHSVEFLNKVTGEVLVFQFRGFNFEPWAPGWCFMELGGIVEHRKG